MQYRTFGKTKWPVSEIGYGMWGMVGWTGSEITEVNKALDRSVELGCTFFDTAWGYAEGESEKLLGKLLKRHPSKTLYYGTKIPPKNLTWPSKPHFSLGECFPASHIIEYTEKSLKNIGVDCLELQQFHVWEDSWASNEEWKEAVTKLKKEGKIKHMGISVNRWEPNNVLETLKTGLIDSVQVIYNVFDQAPEDQLFPLCEELDIAVIARVPFDEGTLTGNITKETRFPEEDWRSTYFVQENLDQCVDKAMALKPLLNNGMTLPEMALKFILENKTVSTIIPGMRSLKHVDANMGTSTGTALNPKLVKALKNHRWDRTPTKWSQ